MKFALLSDVHASSKNSIGRKDDMVEAFFKKFEYVMNYCAENNLTLLQAGDLLDKPRDWFALYRMMEILDGYRSVPIYCIFGQHDMYMRADTSRTPTSLGVLERAGLVTLLGPKPIRLEDGIRLYGCHPGQEVPVPAKKTDMNILVIHAAICIRKLWYGHRNWKTPEGFTATHPGWKLTLAGDIHRKFKYQSRGKTVVNAGPMLRREATEYNMEHEPTFFVYNTNTNDLTEHIIPHEPAEEVLTRTHIEAGHHNEEVLVEFVELLEKFKDVEPEGEGSFPAENTVKENVLLWLQEQKIEADVIEILEEVMSNEIS